MRRISPVALGAALLWLVTLAACGDSPRFRRLPSVGNALAGPANPWDSIPPESIYGATPVDNLRVVPVDLDLLNLPARWEGMRVAVVSDLNLGLWRGNEAVAQAALQRAVSLRPDLIVLLGDFVATGGDTLALPRVLAPVRGRPTLAVLGERDIRTDSLGLAVTRALSAQGVRVLRNGSVPWVFHGDTAFISGVDPELATKPQADQEWILSQLGGAGRKALLLTHLPQMAARAPDGRFPGVLAGHTFCGRVEVPGTQRLSWLTSTGLPGAAVPAMPRFFRLDGAVMFVSCGTGYGFVPVRFGAPPEVALVTLHPVLPAQAAAEQPADSLSLDTLLQRYQRRDSTKADSARADTTR